jgi:hypothetical protein
VSDVETPPPGWWWNPDVSPDQLDQMLADNKGRLVSLSVRSVTSKRLAAIWVAKGPGDGGAGWDHDMTAADIDKLKSGKKVRIVALAPFVKSGKVRFSAAWVPNTGAGEIKWGWDPDVNVAGLGDLLGNNKGRPIVLASYVLAGKRHHATVWVDNHAPNTYGWWWNPDVSEATLAQMLADNKGRLVCLDPFVRDGKLRYGAVWVENTGAHGKAWYWYHGLGPEALGHKFDLFCCYGAELKTYAAGNETHLACVMYGYKPPAVEAAHLVDVTATAQLTALHDDMAPMGQEEQLSVVVTNATNAPVKLKNGRVALHESGGFMDWRGPAFGAGNLLGPAPLELAPGQSAAFGPRDFPWGQGAANLTVDLRAESGGKTQHVSRVAPIVRPGFPAPPPMAAPTPVYFGVWTNPAEVFSLWKGDKATQWITVAGQIVNTSLDTVRLAAWHLTLEIDGKKVVDEELEPDLWTFDDNGAHKVPVGADGAAYLADLTTFFARGFELPTVSKSFKEGKLTLGANYKVGVKDGVCGYASYTSPVRFVPAATILSPVKGLADKRFWLFGNAPDHNGLGGHEWPQERYAYDITMTDDKGHTWKKNDDASMQKNSNFHIYGKPVFAVRGGTVVGADDTQLENFGNKKNDDAKLNNYVLVKHSDGSYAGYYHLRTGKNTVKKDDPVSAGQQLGEVGNAGGSSEPHLHFGISQVDPTGRGTVVPPVFSDLKTKANVKVTAVPAGGEYIA